MQKLYICMYHYIRDLEYSRFPKLNGMDSKLFEQQLQFFAEKFNVIKMEELIEAVNGNGALPDKALLLTFDDGYADHYMTAFPLLIKYGMQGSFFVPGKVIDKKSLLDVNKVHFILASAPIDELVHDLKGLLDDKKNSYDLPDVEKLWGIYAKENRFDSADVVFVKRVLQMGIPEKLRAELTSILFERYVDSSEERFANDLYMNTDQMRMMKMEGMFFGIHGYNHLWLGNSPIEESKRDIDRALRVMEEFINQSCWVMNYPYGDSNEELIDYISDRGCALGLSTEVRIANVGLDNSYTLPRFDCNDFPPKSNNYENG